MLIEQRNSPIYNSQPKVAEVLVDGDQVQVIRQRESYENLVRGGGRI
ncbi:MAG: hypothetical protein QTN59_18240 [Candidatus Electrothrix communis]|nr:MAG: hypothetical protein QTN59_18240 [Candidatus Electrothrix communis]